MEKKSQQADRQKGACFQPQAMQPQAPSSPGGEQPGVLVPHLQS